MDGYECAGCYFYSDFDSANLNLIENVPAEQSSTPHSSFAGKSEPALEFNLWTKPDCAGTEFENGNRTWFYFGIKCSNTPSVIKFNMMNLNKQAKLYSQGMGPVYKIVPGKICWDRICDKPTYTTDNNVFILSFKFRVPENSEESITYFAFTYPYTFSDLQIRMELADRKHLLGLEETSLDDIYYVRERVCNSLEGNRVDLLTITSHHNMTNERETRLKNLFPDENTLRPFKFADKKVIFMSARVHPGETPSSFVLNGFLNLILSKDDTIAKILRKMYVFKLIPCLNPDGVIRGHYRTDTRGVNLNRVYLNPSLKEHPTIYAARALIRYHHYGYEKEDDEVEDTLPKESLWTDVSHMSIEDKNNKNVLKCKSCCSNIVSVDMESSIADAENADANVVNSSQCIQCGEAIEANDNTILQDEDEDNIPLKKDSGLFLYIDMHGHASKKGIFMYGNHFDSVEHSVECMLLPKIMSINNSHFHFSACNFTEKNMYLKDKRDGMSKEGSGRVAVYKITGLVQSYTLECNYNTGRMVNSLPPSINAFSPKLPSVVLPPKYNPSTFEEVGKAIGYSILDLTSQNPYTRIPNSEHRSLSGLKDCLRLHCEKELGDLRKSTSLNSRFRHSTSNLHAQGKAIRSVILKTRSITKFLPKNLIMKKRTGKKGKNGSPEIIHRPSCSHSTDSFPEKSQPVITMMQILKKREEDAKLNIKSSPLGPCVQTRNKRTQTKLKGPMPEKKPEVDPEAAPKSPKEKSSRMKLKEICFVKDSEGKRMIAKYESKKKVEDNLIISWNKHGTDPQVYSQSSRLPAFLSSRVQASEKKRRRRVRANQLHKLNGSTAYEKKRNKKVFKCIASPSDPKTKTKLAKKSKKDKAI